MNYDADNKMHHLTQDMVFIAVEIGFAAVQEVAAKTLITQPNLSLKDFVKVLDECLIKQREINHKNG